MAHTKQLERKKGNQNRQNGRLHIKKKNQQQQKKEKQKKKKQSPSVQLTVRRSDKHREAGQQQK